MQEGQVVGWDIHHMWNTHPRYYDWFALLLLVFSIVAILWVVAFWWRFARRARISDHLLQSIHSSLARGDRAGAASIAVGFSPSDPEAGLREWESLPQESGSHAFLQVLLLADAQFRHTLERYWRTIRSLVTMMGLAVLSAVLALALDMHSFLDFLLEEKSANFRWVLGWVHEVHGYYGGAMWVLLILFVVYRYMVHHLHSRQAAWDFFYSRASLVFSSSLTDTSLKDGASK